MGAQKTAGKCLRRGKPSLKAKLIRYFNKHKGNQRKLNRKGRRKAGTKGRRIGMKREDQLKFHPFLPYIELEKVGDIVHAIPIRNIHGRLIPKEPTSNAA